jgi:hypothetical protein
MDNIRQAGDLKIQLLFPLPEEIMARMRDS